MLNLQPIQEARRWAMHPARVFDGELVRPGMAVLIEDKAIVAVLPVAELPRDVPVLAAPECTLLPGLIDLHTHFMRWEGPLYLAYGVTTVRDVANPAAWILPRRAEAARHPWPRIYTTGPALDGPVPHWPEISQGCHDPADGCRVVRELASAGVDGIKLYVRLPTEWLAEIVTAAHAAGLPVMMHCGSQGVLAAGRAGVDEFFHLDGLLADIWPDCPYSGWLELWGHNDFPGTWARQQQVADEIARLGLITTPTLTVWDMFCRTRFQDQPLPEDAPYLPRPLLQWLTPHSANPALGAQWARALARAQQFTGLLIERQVPVLPGTDVPWTLYQPGHLLWRELAYLTGAGMTSLNALRAATSQAARVLRAEGLGRLAPGCVADLVLVEGDPTQAIPTRPVIAGVVHGGRLYEQATLLALAAGEVGDIAQEPMGLALGRLAAGTGA